MMKLREEKIHTAVQVVRFVSVIPCLLSEILKINIFKTVTLSTVCSCNAWTGNNASSVYQGNYLYNDGYFITKSFVCLRQLIIFLTEQWNSRGCSLLISAFGYDKWAEEYTLSFEGETLLGKPKIRWGYKGKVFPVFDYHSTFTRWRAET